MSNNIQRPILYSFRRCPYAMRARLGIVISGISVELREILLKDKPQEMLDISAKGTVPVLQLLDGSVLDESLDILYWALAHPEAHKSAKSLSQGASLSEMKQLIGQNDQQFKASLDGYKYSIRFPDKTELEHRQDCEVFLQILEQRLASGENLFGKQVSVADIAIFPFIRQFAGVDRQWFDSSAFKNVRSWLARHLESETFVLVMKKYPLWKDDKQIVTVFPNSE
jgi:glutathione S-transferase